MASEALFSLNGGCGYVLKPQLEANLAPELAPELAPRLLKLRVISAHNLPKTRDERCVPQAWDEFEAPCDFAQLPLTTADVASPMCEVELLG